MQGFSLWKFSVPAMPSIKWDSIGVPLYLEQYTPTYSLGNTNMILNCLKIGCFFRFSSFVQMRGSIPSYWSQDVSKMVPKPAISIDLSDPFAEIPGKHLNNLMRRYGSPIMFLNLVKKREKKKHESLLTDVISNGIKYLNQFLPPEHAVQYYHLDMARTNKRSDAKVLDK